MWGKHTLLQQHRKYPYAGLCMANSGRHFHVISENSHRNGTHILDLPKYHVSDQRKKAQRSHILIYPRVASVRIRTGSSGLTLSTCNTSRQVGHHNTDGIREFTTAPEIIITEPVWDMANALNQQQSYTWLERTTFCLILQSLDPCTDNRSALMALFYHPTSLCG